VADLQNSIEELEKIDADLNISTKIGILNRALPENLALSMYFNTAIIGKNAWTM